MTPSFAKRERLTADPAAVIATLPAMGKLMITAKNLGATHERIGSIETVVREDGWLIVGGAEHASRIDPAAIAEIIVDRTSIMGEQAYPRIDFKTRDDVVLFSVVGFAGLEPFDAALTPFEPGIELEVSEAAPRGERGEVSESDPGAVPFKAAIATALPISICFDRPGFHQQWDGVVETVKPAMGFNNVMRADFHLHLKADAVTEWREEPAEAGVALVAFDADGNRLGLSVVGTAAAFAEVAVS